MIAALTALLGSPAVTKWLPVLVNAVASYFDRRAERLELKSAVVVAKNAKTAEELRRASERLDAAIHLK